MCRVNATLHDINCTKKVTGPVKPIKGPSQKALAATVLESLLGWKGSSLAANPASTDSKVKSSSEARVLAKKQYYASKAMTFNTFDSLGTFTKLLKPIFRSLGGDWQCGCSKDGTGYYARAGNIIISYTIASYQPWLYLVEGSGIAESFETFIQLKQRVLGY
jgi:hypothetical protein